MFAWLRPNDLIWNYWVNNYLLGKEPPAFDILYWNADTTNMPAALHRDFVEMSLENTLVEPGGRDGARHAGRPEQGQRRLLRRRRDRRPHRPLAERVPTTQLLGSEPRFVLSTSGHIAAMVNPPGNQKATLPGQRPEPASRPTSGCEQATQTPGTWWDDWVEWLSTRSGDEKNAPRKLGRGQKHKALDPAPGKYVLEEA